MANNPTIVAGVDLGSNTFRLLIANYLEGRLLPLVKKTVAVRLSQGLATNQFLQDECIDRALQALGSFRKNLSSLEVQHLRICGTAALRNSRNSADFLQRARNVMGQAVEIIDGDEEARLSLAGALSALRGPSPESLLLVDVGGGSTELVLTGTRQPAPLIKSLPLGVVGLTEQFLEAATLEKSKVQDLDNYLTEVLKPALHSLQLLEIEPKPEIMGCGGTATSMGALDLNLTRYDEFLVQGHLLQTEGIDLLWNRLCTLSVHKRNALPGLGEGRGEILPAGMRIYQALLKLLGVEHMGVSDAGLLEGITLSSTPFNITGG
jgi:exopolyphosphatase/guanosine-5'-triphosphate,3'-diphosphate pyrophosphatase